MMSARNPALDSFLALVAEMRQAQKRYFRERTPANLEKARQLEVRVDWQINHIRSGERDLFDAAEEAKQP